MVGRWPPVGLPVCSGGIAQRWGLDTPTPPGCRVLVQPAPGKPGWRAVCALGVTNSRGMTSRLLQADASGQCNRHTTHALSGVRATPGPHG